MDLELKGKNVAITGSAKGIGRGIAEGFLYQGANTFFIDKDKYAIKKLKDELINSGFKENAEFFIGDTSQKDVVQDLNEFLGQSGGLNHLVCNVGSGVSVPPLEENVDEFKRMLDINLLNAVNVVTELLPILEKSTRKDHLSTITFISSICGIEVLSCPVAYSSAKSALTSYAKNISFPLGKKGIRVNVVSPGNIMFPGSTWDKKLNSDPKMVNEMISSQVPLQTFGSIEDIANAVVFLASPRARFITGTNIVVDGGQTRS